MKRNITIQHKIENGFGPTAVSDGYQMIDHSRVLEETEPTTCILCEEIEERVETEECEEITRFENDVEVSRCTSHDDSQTTVKTEYIETLTNLSETETPGVTCNENGKTLVLINGKGNTSKQFNGNLSSTSIRPLLLTKDNKNSSLILENPKNLIQLMDSVIVLRNYNKELAKKLARVEREAQELRIQMDLHEKACDARFAYKVAELIEKLTLGTGDKAQNSILNSLEADKCILTKKDDQPICSNISLEEMNILDYCPQPISEEQNKKNQTENEEINSEDTMTEKSDKSTVSDTNQKIQIVTMQEKIELYRQQLALKDIEIRQLEEEVGNVHRCNQQLNAKLGSMVIENGFLNRGHEKELKKALKDRTAECDSLKKKLDKFERDRQQWENQKKVLEMKQPMDVQMLQSEKRELRMQLDREQSEKQEVILEINNLVAQLADANRKALDEKGENEKLEKQLHEIQMQLNTDVRNLEEEVTQKSKEVESSREEAKRFQERYNTEKARLQETIDELQRNLQMKSAALQSLMLAKQETKTSEVDAITISRLKSENADLQNKTDELKRETEKKVNDLEFENAALKQKLVGVQSDLEAVREAAKQTEATWIMKQNEDAGNLKKLEELLKEAKMEVKTLSEKLEEKGRIAEDLQKKLEKSEKELDEKLENEKERMNENSKMFEDEVKERETKIKELEDLLKKKELQAGENEKEIKDTRLKLRKLEENLEALKVETSKKKQDVDEQVKILCAELERANKRIEIQAEDLEKAEADADEAEKSCRETIGELEEEVKTLQEKLKIMENNEDERRKRLLLVESEKKMHQQTSEEYSARCDKLAKDLEDVRSALTDSKAILEKFKAENEKLSAKASLEDEVLTLATSLQSARDDNSAKQSEIASLRKELRELRTEHDNYTSGVVEQNEAMQAALKLANTKCNELTEQIEACKEELKAQQVVSNDIEKKLNAEITKWKDSVTIAENIIKEKDEHEKVLLNEIANLRIQVLEKEDHSDELKKDLEARHTKELNDLKKDYNDRILTLNKEIEDLKISQKNQIDELNVVMTSLRNELLETSKHWNHSADAISNRTSQKEDDNQELKLRTEMLSKDQRSNQDAYSDFETKLAALKECIVNMKEQSDGYLSSQKMVETSEESTQTLPQAHAESHIISIVSDSSDEENARDRLDRDVELLRREVGLMPTVLKYDKGIMNTRDGDKLKNLEEMVESLKKRIANEEAEKIALKDDVVMLEEMLWKKEDEFKRINTINYSENEMFRENEIVELRKELDIVKGQLEEAIKENRMIVDGYQKDERLNGNDNEFTRELNLIRRENVLLQKDNDKLKEELSVKDEYMKSMQKNLESFQENTTAEKNLEKMNIETDELKINENEREKYQEEMKSLNDQCEKFKRESIAKDLDIASLLKDTDILNDEMKSLRSELSEAHQRRIKLEDEKKILTKENETLKRSLAKAEADFNISNEQYKKYVIEVESLNYELSKAKQEQQLSMTELSQIKDQSSNLINEVNNLKNHLDSVKEENEARRLEAVNRRKEVERLSRERVELDDARKRLAEAIEVSERQAREIENLKAAGAEELGDNDKQKIIDELRDRITHLEMLLENERRKTEANSEAALKEIQGLRAIKEESAVVVSRLSECLETERRRAAENENERRQVAKELDELKAAKKRLENELNELRNSSTDESSDSKRKVSELMAENAHLAGELLRTQSQQGKRVHGEHEDALRKEFKELMEERESIWKRKEEAMIEERREEMIKLRNEFKEQLKLRDEKWKKRFNENAKELEDEKNKIHEIEKKLLEERHRLEAQMKKSGKVDRAGTSTSDLEEKLKELEREKRILSEKLGNAQGKIEHYESTLHRLKESDTSFPSSPGQLLPVNENNDAAKAIPMDELTKKLKAENEMQRRLIVVLRRKLQSSQASS